MTRGLVSPPAHPSAGYGIRAHAIAAQWLNEQGLGEPDDAEMAEIVNEYVGWCEAMRSTAAEYWWVEQPVTLETMHPPAPMFGTPDFMCFSIRDGEGLLDVADLKTGREPVYAKENPQLMYYALAALKTIGPELPQPVELVHLHIVQPRRHRVSMWETTPEELDEFGQELLAAAKRALMPRPVFNPGPQQCHACAAKHVCFYVHKATKLYPRRAHEH